MSKLEESYNLADTLENLQPIEENYQDQNDYHLVQAANKITDLRYIRNKLINDDFDDIYFGSEEIKKLEQEIRGHIDSFCTDPTYLSWIGSKF